MAQRTLLKYVQLVLSNIDSDEVESYDETVDSIQVADLLEHTYYEIINRRDWEFTKHRPRVLSISSVKCNLGIPSDIMHIEKLQYQDANSKFRDLAYVSPADFLDRVNQRDPSATEVDQVAFGDVYIRAYNDRQPSFWTSFDEESVTFDAYPAATGTDANDVLVLATVEPAWEMADSFVPDMPNRMESLLLYETISAAWVSIKQQPNAKAESIARRQFARMQHLERKTHVDIEEIDYGRKPRGYTRLYTGR